LIETAQLEEAVRVVEPPKLLVEWTPRWQEFLSCIGPALARSERRLAGEAPFGLIPYTTSIGSFLLEAFLIFVAIVVPAKIEELRPKVVTSLPRDEVVYYTGDELPRTQDRGGAESGKTGRAGGGEAHHHSQTIKVARGGSLTPRVVDAPNLKLPQTQDAVANLLAIHPNAGPPPVEGLRSSRSTPNLSSVVQPAPNVTRDYTRNGVELTAVVPPAPNASRDQPLTAPTLNTNVIPPAPNVSEHALVAPALGPQVIPPAPKVSRDRTLTAPALNSQVIAPAPSISRDNARSTPSMAANVIPPAPGTVSHEIRSAPVQMTNDVVPPPASAPERASTREAKVSLPAPSVIAPPPSADLTQDMHRLASGSADPTKAVVPPPPSAQAGSGSMLSSLIGKIFGPSQVVAPPPSVNSNSARGSGTTLATNVVPPPPSVGASSGGSPQGMRNGAGVAQGPNVIAPPPSSGISGADGVHSRNPAAAPSLGPASIVPPPPQLAGAGGGTGTTGGGAGAPSGTLLTNNVVPPPPSVGGGSGGAGGTGLGRTGPGFGAPIDSGSAAPSSTSGGSGPNAGAVVSAQPGTKVAMPANGGTGALAISPTGSDKPGLGGSGGGTSIGHGNGSGSSMSGDGTGAGRANTGRGADPNSHGGISPNPGPGGAGNAPAGVPPVTGVDISGGSSVVTIPSFGSDAPNSDPPGSAHSSKKDNHAFGVTIVATASSGGAFEPYKNLLHGEAYTTYLDTSAGTVVMGFANEGARGLQTLTAPQAIRIDLPAGLPRARLLVKCILDASGNLRVVRVLEAGPADMTAKVTAALRSWKFQPAMRGEQPVEVTAILGFNIDTNDRF
jgi:hypothetical protein